MTMTASLSSVLAITTALTVQAQNSPVEVNLNLPVGAPMLLQISDDRMVDARGTRATFVVTLHLKFERSAADGWTATVEQSSISCDGPRPVCAAYEAALGPRTGQRQTFAVNRQGAIGSVEMRPPPVEAGGALGTEFTAAVASLEQSSPGAIAAAELVEALRFASSRQPLPAVFAGDNIVTVEDAATLESSPEGGTIRRINRATVDLRTGLVTDCTTETVLTRGGDADRQLGVRRWTLRPVATAQ